MSAGGPAPAPGVRARLWDVVDTVESARATPQAIRPWPGSPLTVAFAIEPDAGVAGAVGRVRAAGARPVAILDVLRLGPLDAAATAEALHEVLVGVARAHDLGLPIIAGEVVLDPAHAGNPLVNVLCVGVHDEGAAQEATAGRHAGGGQQARGLLDGVDARAWARPPWMDGLAADRAEALPRASGAELGAQVLRLVGSPNLCDRSWITDQFDRYAGGDTVLAQPEDAGVIRVEEGTGRGIAVSVDTSPRHFLLSPALGAQLAVAEAFRNVATTGARPIAIATGLNVGSPDDPAVGWQHRETARGVTDGAAGLGIPVTSGGVAFHARGGVDIRPTPVIAVLGALDDVATRTSMGFAHPGDAVVLLGETREELSGSAWADVVHDHLGGVPPQPNLAAEQALAGVLREASRRELPSSAHDLSEGGLAQALVESALRNGLGVALTLPDGDPTVLLFSESPARALVSIAGPQYPEFTALCADAGVPVERLGEVVAEPVLEVHGQFALDLAEVRARWEAPLRDRFGGTS